jgi:hypothetical protein
MSTQPRKGIRILTQVLRGILIGLALGILVMMVLSILASPRPNHGASRTLNDVNDLARSLKYYEEEYGKLPSVPSMDFETEGPQAVELITLLLGKENPDHEMQNPRQIAFLTMRVIKNRKQGGLVISPKNEIVGVFDVWGNPLRVILRPPGKTATTISYRGKEVASSEPAVVLSRGADGKWGTEDDLMSTSGKP